MGQRKMALLGFSLLLLGVFMPLFSAPIIGWVSYNQIYAASSTIIAVTSIVGIILALRELWAAAFVLSAFCVFLLLGDSVELYHRIQGMERFHAGLSIAPAVLWLGAILASGASRRQAGRSFWPQMKTFGRFLLLVVLIFGGLLAVVGGGIWVYGHYKALTSTSGAPPASVKSTLERHALLLRHVSGLVSEHYARTGELPSSIYSFNRDSITDNGRFEIAPDDWEKLSYQHENGALSYRSGVFHREGKPAETHSIYVTMIPRKGLVGELSWECYVTREAAPSGLDDCKAVSNPLKPQ